MAAVDLDAVLRDLREEADAAVGRILEAGTLPPEIREGAPRWAAGILSNLAAAGAARARDDSPAYDAAMREVGLFRKAFEAVATGEVLAGIGAAEAESRRALSTLLSLVVNVGTKAVLAAVL